MRHLLVRDVNPPEPWNHWWHDPRAVLRRWAAAKDIAADIGFDGKLRSGEGPCVIPLPSGDYDCGYLIAWKQDNNGSCFIASPYPLPWIAREAHGSTKGEYDDQDDLLEILPDGAA
jgi:hypothetical protein